tara:strand:+ start:2257 stop:2439 length:183 start_codon:yes stop_codon:yes gene_type:complete
MNFNKLREENKTLKKKIKNLKRTKLRLKHNLNKKIQIIKDQLKTHEIGYNWESLECEKKI